MKKLTFLPAALAALPGTRALAGIMVIDKVERPSENQERQATQARD